MAPEKSDLERPSVRPAMCERSPLGLPHTQNRMSGLPRVAEILLMISPKTLRVCGDLKTTLKAEVCGVGWTVGGNFFANCPYLHPSAAATSRTERPPIADTRITIVIRPKLKGRTRRRAGHPEGGSSCGTHEDHVLPGCVRAHPRTQITAPHPL